MAFSTTGTAGGYTLSSEINITPLIDVLLVLLIIFMVMVPLAPLGLDTALPSTADAPAIDHAADSPVLVQVEQGRTAVHYFVAGVPMGREEIAPRLRELLSRTSARQMLLRADPELDFGAVAGVIDAGTAAGAESIGLITPGIDAQRR